MTIYEVRVPGLDVTLFFAPDLASCPRGMRRGRVWTHAELRNLKGLTREEALRIAETKVLFDAAGPWPDEKAGQQREER